MIQQPGSSLLLMKLLKFVVSGVTEMTNPPGFQASGSWWKMGGKSWPPSFVRFFVVICIFKIVNHQRWSDGGKLCFSERCHTCFSVAWRVVVSGSSLGSVVCWYQCLLWSLVGVPPKIYCGTAGERIKGWKSFSKGCLHQSAKDQLLVLSQLISLCLWSWIIFWVMLVLFCLFLTST